MLLVWISLGSFIFGHYDIQKANYTISQWRKLYPGNNTSLIFKSNYQGNSVCSNNPSGQDKKIVYHHNYLLFNFKNVLNVFSFWFFCQPRYLYLLLIFVEFKFK